MQKNNVKFKIIFTAILFLGIFGLAKNSMAWTTNADFENGELGQPPQGASGFTLGYAHSYYSDTLAKSGTKSARHGWQTGDTDNITGGSWTFQSDIPEDGEVWVRGYYYFKTPWSWTTNSYVKVMRVFVKSAADVGIGNISILSDTGGQLVINSELASPNYNINTGYYPATNQWTCLETYVKFNHAQGITRVWVDGVLIAENATARTLIVATDIGKSTRIFTAWNGGSPQNQDAFTDDYIQQTDRPVNQDTAGNYMIGPIDWENNPDITPPSTPAGLSVQ